MYIQQELISVATNDGSGPIYLPGRKYVFDDDGNPIDIKDIDQYIRSIKVKKLREKIEGLQTCD